MSSSRAVLIGVSAVAALAAACGAPEVGTAGPPPLVPVTTQKLPKITIPPPDRGPFVTQHHAVFAEPRLYEHVLIPDEEECQRALETGFNCSQTLELCPDGKAFLMVTDIINPATYAQQDGTVRLDLAQGREPGLAESLVFTVVEDEDALVDEYGNAWTRSTPSWALCN